MVIFCFIYIREYCLFINQEYDVNLGVGGFNKNYNVNFKYKVDTWIDFLKVVKEKIQNV